MATGGNVTQARANPVASFFKSLVVTKLDRGEIALDAPTSSLTYTELTDFLMSLHKPRVAAQ